MSIYHHGTVRKSSRWLSVAVILIVSLFVGACQTPDFLQAELPDDGLPIATSFVAAQRLIEKVSTAGEQAANTGKLNITVTQEEVTSLLSIGSQISEQLRVYDVGSLQDLQGIQQTTNAPELENLTAWTDLLEGRDGLSSLGLSELALRLAIAEPEVYFKGNGQVIVRGYGKLLVLRQPLRLVLAPRASDGELVLDFVEGNLGPVGVPESLVDQIGKGLATVIMAGEDHAVINKIQVSEGKLRLTGRYRQ